MPAPEESEVERPRGDTRPPNVLLILADDLSWADVSMHGSRFHRTPHVDALAARGVRFSQAVSASPLCSPTRASILTGRDPARHGVTAPMGHLPEDVLVATLPEESWPDRRVVTPATANRIAHEHVTLAEAFGEAGYDTALFGKWHLGGGDHHPSKHGFGHVRGGGPHAGPPSYYAPFGIDDLPDAEDGAYLTDVLVDGAVEWLGSPRERPFFACLWFYNVHSPFQARADLREAALERLDPEDPQRAPTYAAMVQSLDDGVGRVLATLEAAGVLDDTLVVFTSDNGGNQYDTLYAELPDAMGQGVPATRNLPFRGGKGMVTEGGIRVPLVFAWPRAVEAGTWEAGRVTEAFATSTDLYPTLLELAGLPARPEQVLDGFSLAAALRGDAGARDQQVVLFPHDFPSSGQLAAGTLRWQDWKLVRTFAVADDGSDRDELFDLRADVREEVDRAAEEPAVLERLQGRMDAYFARTAAVLPRANPNFDPVTERWQAGPDVVVSIETNDGIPEHVVESFAADPFVATPFGGPLVGRLALEFEVKGAPSGVMELFWTLRRDPALRRDRGVSIQVEADEDWQPVRIEFDTGGMLGALRLDPLTGEGAVRLRGLRLVNVGGDVVRDWRPVP